MAHDVFISYSSIDSTIANAVCASLEAEGIRCWIAPRDILHGMDWAESIIYALDESRIVSLVFSANSNTSLQVKREVQRAFEKRLIVIPFRVEDVMPSKALEYYIGSVHWLDALTPPMERHLKQLVTTAKQILANTATDGDRESQSEHQIAQPIQVPDQVISSPLRRNWALGVGSLVLALSLLLVSASGHGPSAGVERAAKLKADIAHTLEQLQDYEQAAEYYSQAANLDFTKDYAQKEHEVRCRAKAAKPIGIYNRARDPGRF
jgi:hypothetical protein